MINATIKTDLVGYVPAKHVAAATGYVQIVAIGDSLCAGLGAVYPSHWYFDRLTFFTSWYKDRAARAYSTLNRGVGGETIAQIQARYAALIALSPSLVIAGGGTNDVTAGTTEADFIAAWTAILNATPAETRILVDLIPPRTALSDAQSTTRDSLNTALTTFCAGYANARVVDHKTLLGKYRASGPPGNLWDILDAYNSDDTHLNDAGYEQMAKARYLVL